MTRRNENSEANFPRQRLLARRRGFSSIFLILALVIGLALMMLVVNFTYLMLVNRHSLQLTDTLSHSAVSQLLDENVLLDIPHDDQTDDIDEARTLIFAPNTGLLARNNAGTGSRLQAKSDGDNIYEPATDDVNVFAARVDDASAPVTGSNLEMTPSGQPFNTLVVEVLRRPNGLNPVELLMRGFGVDNGVQVSAASYATLDSRVVGFRPTALAATPLVPLAVSSAAWSARATGGIDATLPNGRLELDVTLKTTAGAGSANAALISTDDSAGSVNYPILASQILSGVMPDQVNAGQFGPAAASDPLTVAGDDVSPAPELASIVAALNDVAASIRPQRIFPLYSTAGGSTASIVGFIAARVLEAEAIGGNQLRVRIEPDFVIHPTAETRRHYPAAPIDVPENPYIHKIRITR